MMFSRRGFIVAGQALLASAALPLRIFGAAGSSSLGSSKVANLGSLTKANFLPLVNSSFAVGSSSLTTAWFTLLSVEDMNPKTPALTTSMAVMPKKTKTPAAKLDTFALHFHGTGEALPQGTYEFEHRSLGKFSLFIVPSGATTYAAIISHLLSAAPLPSPLPIKAKPKAGVPVRSESLSPTL